MIIIRSRRDIIGWDIAPGDAKRVLNLTKEPEGKGST
jgi:hypothetical protein